MWMKEQQSAVDDKALLELTIAAEEVDEEKEMVVSAEAKDATSTQLSTLKIPKKTGARHVEVDARVSTCDEKIKNAADAAKACIDEAFALHHILLGEDQRPRWDAIVDKICNRAWFDDEGKMHEDPRGKSWQTLKMCTVEWLSAVFPADAAEKEREYLQYFIVNPIEKITIATFIKRFEQLNNYLKNLPCLADSKLSSIRMNKPFTEAEEVPIMLRAFPFSYENAYRMTHSILDSNPRLFRRHMEETQRVMLDQKKARAALLSSSNNQPNATNTSGGTKRKGDDKQNSSPQKKARVQKHCTRCQEFGGAAQTHNTLECKKYDKAGNLLPTFKSKKKSDKTTVKNVNVHSLVDAQMIAELSASVAKLEKRIKKQKVAVHSNAKHKHKNSFDSTSDSE